MATPGQLIDCIASSLSVPTATVFQYDRILAENGLRTKGGRGRSAAQVTPADAASLLVVVAGAPATGPSVTVALDTLAQFGVLRAKVSKPKPPQDDFLRDHDTFGAIEKQSPTLAKLKRRHTLHSALAAMIEAAIRDEIWENPSRIQERTAKCFISLEGPHPRASIAVSALRIQTSVNLRYESVAERQYSDLFWKRTFTGRTITRIADLLSQGSK